MSWEIVMRPSIDDQALRQESLESSLGLVFQHDEPLHRTPHETPLAWKGLPHQRRYQNRPKMAYFLRHLFPLGSLRSCEKLNTFFCLHFFNRLKRNRLPFFGVELDFHRPISFPRCYEKHWSLRHCYLNYITYLMHFWLATLTTFITTIGAYYNVLNNKSK